MKKNMGQWDRVLRTIVAVVFAFLVYFKVVTGALAWILGVIAVIFLLTSLIRFCPLYVPFKISTDKGSEKK